MDWRGVRRNMQRTKRRSRALGRGARLVGAGAGSLWPGLSLPLLAGGLARVLLASSIHPAAGHRLVQAEGDQGPHCVGALLQHRVHRLQLAPAKLLQRAQGTGEVLVSGEQGVVFTSA